MKLKYLLAASVVSLSAAAIVPAPLAAQETTSAITGAVTDESGNPIPGATVVLTDTRTGRTSTSTTSSQGAFNFRTLEVGGPYTVVVNAAGYQGERVDGIAISLSDTRALRFALAQDAAASVGDEIVVTAAAVSTPSLALGPGSSFGLDTLEEQPTINRDIRDVIALDPRVTFDSGFPDDNGAVSCLGASERNNSLTIDGVRIDDGFGLGSTPFPSEAQPFPFEALSSVSVEFAPFDVQYGLFSGCNINVVTKSGSNDFFGGGYFFYNDDSLIGDTVDGRNVSLGKFETKKYGGYLGGPIVEDRLFFFVSYDREDGSRGEDDGPLGSGAANEAQNVTQAEIDQVQQILQNVYGFDAGDVVTSLPNSTERLFARIDANISDRHRLAFSYGLTREDFVSSGEGSNARFDEIALSSNFYQSGNKIDSYSARLFSDWTDNFSTEIRLSRLENRDVQDSLGGTDFQQFEITTPSGGTIFVGPDRFRQRNDLETTTDQAKIAAFATAGNHFFTIGAEYDRFDVLNLFVQDGTGTAEFDSFADLQAGTPSDFVIRVPVSGNIDDATALFEREIYTVYAQDEWQLTPDFLLQFGVRYDFYNGDSKPAPNPTFLARYGFSNQTGFDQLDVVQPRAGFRYDAGDLGLGGYTVIRGGVGIFSGGDPTVLFSNSYTNNGITLDDVFLNEIQAANITDFLGEGVQPNVLPLAVAGDGEVNAIDPDFEIPRVLRANFGVEHQFDFGPTLMIDYIYSKNNNPLFVQDLTLAQIGTAPDGRPLYRQVDFLDPDCATNPASAACSARTTSDYLLTNGKGGRGHVASVSLRDSWPQGGAFLGIGGDITIGYSYSDVTEIQPLTSSRAVSNYGNFSKIDVNNPEASRSNASRSHNALFRLNLEKDLFGDNTTEFTFFLKYRTGQPFSYNFDTPGAFNPFGDSNAFEDRVLLYVPAVNDPTVTYAPGFDLAAFNQYLADSGLDEYRGSIVPRNAFDSGDYWDLDLRFSQELPGFFGSDRFKFIVDVENALNLIDSSWNTLRDVSFEYNVPIVQTQINGAGQYEFVNFVDPRNGDELVPLSTSTGPSVWQVQFGLRYEF
ncbi:TonB-dependent receptor [Citromicrobium bathyomarinum]|jgi:outer membrane receptor for ferrienterochelin and colicin|uniref:TonB-dependent receptor n=1 Tax=Sphingomonadales TaxID=204457 RepID=UPI000C515895|nr:TonB-dependent receptor [Citromicrobium sp.]MBO81568.1 hypothetical protein [Citromicrobium sp.]|tara:strand:- start:541 stop:3774 length:3234 start_codon:yes stop_codon:yes gene_type:complete